MERFQTVQIMMTSKEIFTLVNDRFKGADIYTSRPFTLNEMQGICKWIDHSKTMDALIEERDALKAANIECSRLASEEATKRHELELEVKNLRQQVINENQSSNEKARRCQQLQKLLDAAYAELGKNPDVPTGAVYLDAMRTEAWEALNQPVKLTPGNSATKDALADEKCRHSITNKVLGESQHEVRVQEAHIQTLITQRDLMAAELTRRGRMVEPNEVKIKTLFEEKTECSVCHEPYDLTRVDCKNCGRRYGE